MSIQFHRANLGVSVLLVVSIIATGLQRTARADDEAMRDLEIVKQRIFDSVLKEPVNDTLVRHLMDTITPEGSWSDIDYDDQNRALWIPFNHINNLTQLSLAYRSPKSSFQGDRQLRKAILDALDYWFEHDFQGPTEWWNSIGVPKFLGDVLILMEEELSADQIRAGCAILHRGYYDGMWHYHGPATGQNLIWLTKIHIVRACLEKSTEEADIAFKRSAEEIVLTTDEGIQADFSFHQHGALLYSHGYGERYAEDCASLAAFAMGTRFAFSPETIDIICGYLLDGQQWMCRGSATDYGAEGREITRKGESARYLGEVARTMLNIPTGREAEFAALADRAEDRDAPPLIGNRHFWRSDIMTHQRGGYYASARMFSDRLHNTDAPCNEEGLRSHHIADGCNFIYRTGKEYYNIFPVWDWQKIPGTTVEQKPELTEKPCIMGNRPFVGGVSDGTYGMAVFDFVRDSLSARKAWVFFDDEFVCLGAGITCNSDNQVVTTVNQCFLHSDVTTSISGKQQQLPNGDRTVHNPAWIHHDDIAYIFPEPVQLVLCNKVQTGSWWYINRNWGKTDDNNLQDEVSHEVFNLWIEHGKKPENRSYVYIVAPDLPLSSTADYAAAPGVDILQNDTELQAVRHKKLDITSAAFYTPGALRVSATMMIEVDNPCLVLVREMGEEVAVSVSNPENTKLTVVVKVRRTSKDDAVALAEKTPVRFVFDLPGGMYAGKSVTQTQRLP